MIENSFSQHGLKKNSESGQETGESITITGNINEHIDRQNLFLNFHI